MLSRFIWYGLDECMLLFGLILEVYKAFFNNSDYVYKFIQQEFNISLSHVRSNTKYDFLANFISIIQSF